MLKKIKNKLRPKVKGKLPIALIGASGWGGNYLHRLSLSKDFDINIVMDINQNVLKHIEKKYGYRTVTDIDDIINSEVNTVFIVLPNHLHFEVAKQLLENGKNVYIEKPLANSSDEAKLLNQIAYKNGVILYTCHNLAYESYMLKVKEFIQNGTIGKVYGIEIERSLPTAFNMRDNDWRNDSVSCPFGPLMQLGIHFIDYLNNIFGEFTIEYGAIGSNVIKNDDYFYGVVNYGDISCKLKFSYISHNVFKIVINAEKFDLSFNGKELTKFYHNGKTENITFNQSDSLTVSIDEFYMFIQDKNIKSNTLRAINSIESIERVGIYAREV